MKLAGWLTGIYALIVLVGGIIGHLQAQSTVSLITGVIFGVLLLLCALGIYKDRLFPAYSGILLILLLDAFFTYRWLFTFRFFPSGMMAIVSLATFLIVALLIRHHLRNR